jgi:hypothetical protein
MLAWLVLRERVSRLQLAGMLAVLVAVAMVATRLRREVQHSRVAQRGQPLQRASQPDQDLDLRRGERDAR